MLMFTAYLHWKYIPWSTILQNRKYAALGTFCGLFHMANPTEGAVYIFVYLKSVT